MCNLLAAALLDTVAGAFIVTGDLWEKYNAVNGGTRAVDEYGCPAMLGWTAGTYQALRRLGPAKQSDQAMTYQSCLVRN